MSFDMDDIYQDAREILEEKLEREPTDAEVEIEAQEIYIGLCSAAYDYQKDLRKYGE